MVNTHSLLTFTLPTSIHPILFAMAPPPKKKPSCRNVGGQLVCGALAGGGKAHKSGVFRLHKGEKVLTTAQMKKMMAAGKTMKKRPAGKHHKKKCKCKH